MSLRTEGVCRENEAGTESTRHSPGGYIVTQGVGRDALVDLGHLGCGMTGPIELARRHRLHAVASGKQPALGPGRPPPVAQQFEQMGDSIT